MKIIVIGGSGHIGTYLTPALVEAGHQVLNITRAQRQPYQPHGAWRWVETVTLDRAAAEASGEFAPKVRALNPDIVIDLICYLPESARQLIDALQGAVQHFLHCGTIWVHGPGIEPPITEEQPRKPFGEYGCRKAAIEADLLRAARLNGFPATILHPGHIVGPGWAPLNPAGHFNPKVFDDLAEGRELLLPNLGLETVHHVHAADVAQSFLCAIANRSTAIGESFHVVSPAAVTLYGYAHTVAGWFGREANLRFLPWDEWKTTVTPKEAAATWDHIAHSPNCSIRKAERLIGYRPRYRSMEAVREAVDWLRRPTA
ncbi:MAG: NAD-dependent epimerase/dehydratase family protein [Acidobacteria bacterium]|nr:NAD-dependent epimerase/dehydratase family protein [Acidobacteriota bacterium]